MGIVYFDTGQNHRDKGKAKDFIHECPFDPQVSVTGIGGHFSIKHVTILTRITGSKFGFYSPPTTATGSCQNPVSVL